MAPIKKISKCRYSQKYKQVWEDDPLFSKWLVSSSKGLHHAYCKVCESHLSLGAGKSDLLKHSKSKKHKTCEEAVYQQILNSHEISDKFPAEQIHITHFNEDKAEKNIYIPKESLIIVDNNDFYQSDDSREDDITYLLDGVAHSFRNDLEKFINKNKNIADSILQIPGVIEKGDFACITKILVGHMSQHYLIEYTQEMCKINNSSISRKLNSVERLIEKSATEMVNLKAQYRSSNEKSLSHANLSEFLDIKPNLDEES